MHNFRPLLLGITLQFSVQMTGVSALQYYSPRKRSDQPSSRARLTSRLAEIFSALGFNSTETLRYQSYNSVIALFGEFCTILFVDRVGRRVSLQWQRE